MAESKIADLFVQLSIRGGGKAELLKLKDQIAAADKSLSNNAALYKAQTAGKLMQLGKVAERQEKLANLDAKTYASEKYIAMSRKQFAADRAKQFAQSAKDRSDEIAHYGRVGAALRRAGRGVGGAISGVASVPGLIGTSVLGMSAGYAASQASPMHMATLSASFDELAAKLGGHLLPIVDKLSEALQWLADKVPSADSSGSFSFRNLTRKLVGLPLLSDSAMDAERLLAEAATSTNPRMQALHLEQQRRIANNRGAGRANFEIGRPLRTMEEIRAAGFGDLSPSGLRRDGMQPASFSSFENAWRQVQLSAASIGEERERVLQEQLKHLQGLRQDIRELNQAFNRIGGRNDAQNINQPAPNGARS